MTNTCPKRGKVIFEEMYGGTISPELCNCEPVRVWNNGIVEVWRHRPQNIPAMTGGTTVYAQTGGTILPSLKEGAD